MNNHSNLLNNSKFKMSLVCAAVLNVFSVNAYAVEEEQSTDTPQTFSEAKSLDDVEVIEVRGIRSSTEKNLSIKRLSNAMVDAITAEDIGKFPDKNVADSLQRVPGIVIQRDGGEGSKVSIRGLSSDLTYTQLNGNYIASSPGEPSRSFDYMLLPSAMIETVEVYKSPEARIDEGGVGGTVQLKTRTPLNMDSGSGIAQVEYTYSDVSNDYEPQFTGLYSWKNDDEDFGMLVGYTHQKRTNRTLTGSANGWNWTGEGSGTDVNGNPVDNSRHSAPVTDVHGNVYDNHWVPQYVRASIYEEERERDGIQGTLQWAPTDDLEITANYFHFKLGLDSTATHIDFPEWDLNNGSVTNVQTDESGTIITGIDYAPGAPGTNATSDMPWMRGEYTIEESTSDTFDLNIDYSGDDYELSFTVGHTESEGGPSEKYETAYYGGGADNGNAATYYGWDISGKDMSFYLDPNMLNNIHNGVGGGADPGSSNSSFVVSDMEEDYAQIDLDYYVDYSIFTMVRVGTKYRKAELHRETRNTFYLDPNFDIEAGEASEDGITRDDSYQWNGGMPPAELVINPTGDDNIPGGFNTNLFPTMNWNAYQNYLNDNYVKYTRVEDNFVYDIEEEIISSYIQLDFEGEFYRGNMGARYVETTTTGTSTDIYVYQLDSLDDDGNEINDVEDVWSEIEQENTYTNFLPSFNIVFDVSDDIVVRAAVAKVMSRPDYSDLGGQERLTWVSNEWATDRSGQNVDPGWSGYGGNKNLEPFESFQQDISIEYYYGNGSAMGIAFFNKEVDNFVVPVVMDVYRDVPEQVFMIGGEEVVAGGDNTLVEDYSTSGNGSNATSRGIEVFLQHSFDNGFGITTNYTYNDSSEADIMAEGEKVGESALIGSADFQFNFSTYFENDNFSVRASYNLRGDAVMGIQNGMNVYNAEYDQVDVNGSFQITEDLIFQASVINLLEEESYTFLGDDTEDRMLSNSYSGRRMYAGITYNF